MANTALNVKIGADISRLRDEMNKARGMIGNFTKGVNDIKRTIMGAFAVDAVISFGKTAYTAAVEAQRGEQKLLLALKGRQDIQERLIHQAKVLHATTLFEDDAIIAQQALLAAMGRNESQIKNIISAATGLSSALGIELEDAVKALNKSLSGSVTALGKIDPSLKGLTATQLKHGEAIDLVIKKYGEYAAAATNQAGAQTAQFQKNIDDLVENIGNFLIPILGKAAESLNQLFNTRPPMGVADEIDEFISYRKAFAQTEQGLARAKETFISQQQATIKDLNESIKQKTEPGRQP
jgi:phage-related minor tail protein